MHTTHHKRRVSLNHLICWTTARGALWSGIMRAATRARRSSNGNKLLIALSGMYKNEGKEKEKS